MNTDLPFRVKTPHMTSIIGGGDERKNTRDVFIINDGDAIVRVVKSSRGYIGLRVSFVFKACLPS